MLRLAAFFSCVVIGTCFLGGAAGANPPIPMQVSSLPSTSIKTVLTVAAPTGSKVFSLAQLEAMGMNRVTSTTFWPNDDGTYEGPLLSEVLKQNGLQDAEYIRVGALDGYSQLIPRQDWQKWPILLATRRDGRPLVYRTKVPLRIIYPRNMSPELHDEVYRLRWVWLINRIEGDSTK